MFKSSRPVLKFIFIIFFAFGQNAYANISAIDFTKVGYPTQLQPDIDYLKMNVEIYSHWSPKWTYGQPKQFVIDKLTGLYNNLDKLSPKNAEAELLLGEVAHYLYNLDVDPFYQKAVDHYNAAQVLSPDDYRVYWFLGNHYALSNVLVSSIKTYQLALKYLPVTLTSPDFWNEYSQACFTANMTGTAMYAAKQASKIAGQPGSMETHLQQVMATMLRSPPADTTLEAKDMWSFSGKMGNKLIFDNFVLGTKMAVDSNWKLDMGEYKNGTAYVTVTPPQLKAIDGQMIGYTMLILIQHRTDNLSLEQYFDFFDSKDKQRKPAAFTVGRLANCSAKEIIDPTTYPQWGGAHSYTIAMIRDEPQYPGMALEAPAEVPKSGAVGTVQYFVPAKKYTREKGKLYYIIILDSCKYIDAASLDIFKDFLSSLEIE